jgi:AraC-like DNA-binding protein
MKSWKCSTETVRDEERERIWQEALNHIALPSSRLRDHSGFHGQVSSVVSPVGIEFSRISSSAQTIHGACSSRQPYLWLALPVKGTFLLGSDSDPVELGPGDILYGPTGCDSTLTLLSQFCMLYVRIPQSIVRPRLLNLYALKAGRLDGRSAPNRIFSRLLQSIVDDIEELDDDHIRPIEVAVSEFAISTLAEDSAMTSFDAAGAINFHRICQSIEAQLGDGDLSPQRIAEQHNLSTRYVQKLFQQAGTSFTQYLRRRRLEHCRSDLASWTHRNLSVSEICFGWGFNDAAHFSRSFRAHYGLPPKIYRQNARLQQPGRLD